MVEHHASAIVAAPADRVFARFSRLEELPKVLSHVREVRCRPDGSSHWVVDLLGRHEWEARNENWIENRQIGWLSTSGLRNRGLVRFQQLDSQTTRIDVHIWYDPPSGVLGDAGETLGAGNTLERGMQHDLERFAHAIRGDVMNDDNVTAKIRPSEIDTTTMPALDARSHPGKEQIRGALRYDAKALLTEERLTLPLPHDTPIAVYADSEERAAEIAARLREQGYKKATVLEGGFEAYRSAGLPTEEITQEQPVPGHQGAGIPRV